MALAGCTAAQPDGGGDGGTSDAVPRLVINGQEHELNDESDCSIRSDGKLAADVEAVDFEESNAALRFWATPSESRSEVAIDVDPDSPLAQGHGTWEEDDTGVFDGGLEAELDGERLTLNGTFESRVVADYQVEVDFAIDCAEES